MLIELKLGSYDIKVSFLFFRKLTLVILESVHRNIYEHNNLIYKD